MAAHFRSYLFFLDGRVDAPLYELDFPGLRRNAPGDLLPCRFRRDDVQPESHFGAGTDARFRTTDSTLIGGTHRHANVRGGPRSSPVPAH